MPEQQHVSPLVFHHEPIEKTMISTQIALLMGMMDKLPGMSQLPDNVKDKVDDKMFKQMEAIISSMTMKERQRPEIIKGSRKKRIAAGSGVQVQDVNRLLKQFTQMQKMMKQYSAMLGGKGGRKLPFGMPKF